jgi:hypothetical protein
MRRIAATLIPPTAAASTIPPTSRPVFVMHPSQ